MKRRCINIGLATLPGLVVALSFHSALAAEYFSFQNPRLAVEGEPAGFLISYNASDFAVQGFKGQESIAGQGSYYPSLRLGLGLDAPRAVWEIMAGGGMIINSALTAPVLSADLQASLVLAETITIGPRIGFLYALAPDWKGKDSEITLDAAAGFRGGLALTFGRMAGSWSFRVAVDYVALQLAAQRSDAWWPVDDKKLDLSGVLVSAGIAYRPQQEYVRVSPSRLPVLPAPEKTQPATFTPWPAPVKPGTMPATLEPLPASKSTEPVQSTPAPIVTDTQPAPPKDEQPIIEPKSQPPVTPVPMPAEAAVSEDDSGPDDGTDVEP